jgi:branched-subunit amino acid transport protein AzlD
MTKGSIGWKRIIIILLVAMAVYSFLPLIPFWVMEPARPDNNNKASIEKIMMRPHSKRYGT